MLQLIKKHLSDEVIVFLFRMNAIQIWHLLRFCDHAVYSLELIVQSTRWSVLSPIPVKKSMLLVILMAYPKFLIVDQFISKQFVIMCLLYLIYEMQILKIDTVEWEVFYLNLSKLVKQ